MRPNSYIDNFERTEYSDSLQAILGRALIVATKFDTACNAAAISKKLRFHLPLSDQNADILFEKLLRYEPLNENIKSLQLPIQLKSILNDARCARNEVAHNLALSMIGKSDGQIDEKVMIQNVSQLVTKLAKGDFYISTILSSQNREPILRESALSGYVDKIVHWVIEK